MKVFTRTCVKKFEIDDQQGQHWETEVGRDYTVSSVHGDEQDTVTVFSKFWVPVPLEYFGSPRPLGSKVEIFTRTDQGSILSLGVADDAEVLKEGDWVRVDAQKSKDAEIARLREVVAAYEEMNALLLKEWADAPQFPLDILGKAQLERVENAVITTLKNLGMAEVYAKNRAALAKEPA